MGETLMEPHESIDARLLITIAIAIAVHVMVVLGVRLPPEPRVPPRFAAIEVMLVPARQPPLASLPATRLEDVVVAPPPTVAAPSPAPVVPLTSKLPTARRAEKIKTAPRTATSAVLAQPVPRTAPSIAGQDAKSIVNTPAPLPTAAQLIERSLAIASTGAGLINDKTPSGQSLAERTLYTKGQPKDYTQAYYMAAMLAKCKAHGELSHPDTPLGTVGLEVALASDGSLVRPIKVTQSSGNQSADERAIKDVEQAAPYAPFPPEFAQKFSVWVFTITINLTQ